MPLFSTKFLSKKTPARKASVSLANKDLSPRRLEKELGPEVGPIRICLGEQQAVFENGMWIPESGQIGGTFQENEHLKKEIQKLEEENNLLKIKFEVLLDMLTEATAESNLDKEEIESLKGQLSHNRRSTT